jgi:hypothetical protein
MFTNIGGQKHLNKREIVYELRHANLIRSTMRALVEGGSSG